MPMFCVPARQGKTGERTLPLRFSSTTVPVVSGLDED